MKNKKKIGILVVAYNAVSTLSKVLDRIPKNVYEEIDEIAVFDDASKDDTYMMTIGYKEVRKVDKLNIYLNEKNLGYGGNQKQGFEYFANKGFDVVVLLHGDGQYAPEILNELYEPIVNEKADVVLGSRMMKKYGGPLKGGMPLYKYIGNRILSAYQNRKLKMELTEFHSGYRAYSIKGLKKINLNNCSNDFHFDTQIIIKLHHNNLKIIEVPIPTYYGSEICYVNGLKYARNIHRTTRDFIKTLNSRKISETYSEYYNPYPLKIYPYSSHYDVLKILNKKSNQRILDIGCGDGSFSEKIKRSNYKIGIDYLAGNEKLNDIFNKYYQYDINKGLHEKIYDEEKFDVILLLDVLEHLISPDKILNDCKKIIKDDGKIIVSLPNIANIYVRLNLLFGRFPYSDRGILDRTHLHFFTLGSAKKLLRKHNFIIERIKYTPIPVIEVMPIFLKKNLGMILNYLLFSLTLIFRRLLSYQFIFIVKQSN